jgi:hypothetical protein
MSIFNGFSPEACFEPHWLSQDKWGYFTLTNGKGGKSKAHRLSYKLFCGPVEAGEFILHRCGNSHCVNPYHLYVGDAAQNAIDRDSHGTTAKGERLPQTRLSAQDVTVIRQSTSRVVDLAKQFGVSKGCVSNIRHGRSRLGQ